MVAVVLGTVLLNEESTLRCALGGAMIIAALPCIDANIRQLAKKVTARG